MQEGARPIEELPASATIPRLLLFQSLGLAQQLLVIGGTSTSGAHVGGVADILLVELEIRFQ